MSHFAQTSALYVRNPLQTLLHYQRKEEGILTLLIPILYRPTNSCYKTYTTKNRRSVLSRRSVSLKIMQIFAETEFVGLPFKKIP